MNNTLSQLACNQWEALIAKAQQISNEEPSLALFMQQCILGHEQFHSSLACVLANDIGTPKLPRSELSALFSDVFTQNYELCEFAHLDLQACNERDPACLDVSTAFLFFKGYHALQLYRVTHHLWHTERQSLALYLQSRSSQQYDVDIHPAAKLGYGIMLDHATGIVIGETARIGNDVSILHGVTLGGNGTAQGDRHPHVHDGVLISTGAKLLGNIEVGEGAKIAASSLVLESIPPHVTVAGVPAQMVGHPKENIPSLEMQQQID